MRRGLTIAVLLALVIGGFVAVRVATRKAEPIAGDVRADFVRSATAGCIARQKTETDEEQPPADTIQQYCSCYSEKLADRMTQSDIDRLAGIPAEEMQSIMRPKMEESGRICQATIK